MLPYVYIDIMSVELPYSIFIHWKYSISLHKNWMTYVMHYGMISSFLSILTDLAVHAILKAQSRPLICSYWGSAA